MFAFFHRSSQDYSSNPVPVAQLDTRASLLIQGGKPEAQAKAGVVRTAP
jgi:hypothetical protein